MNVLLFCAVFYSSLLLFFFISICKSNQNCASLYREKWDTVNQSLLQRFCNKLVCVTTKICTHVSCCLIEIMRGLYPFTLEMSLFFCPIQSSRIFFTHLEQWICIANYCVITLRKFQRVNKFSSVVQFSVSFFLDLYIKNIRSKLCSVTLQRGTIVLP